MLQFGDEAAARTAIRNLSKNLDSNTLTQYAKLSPADIHQLVVIEKWKIAVRNGIESEVDGLTFDLTSRVHQLGERYSQTVEDIATELAQLEKRVNNHLKAMGVES
ncbi:hypothetical protein ACL1A8_12485 [Corynebacterium striatum]